MRDWIRVDTYTAKDASLVLENIAECITPLAWFYLYNPVDGIGSSDHDSLEARCREAASEFQNVIKKDALMLKMTTQTFDELDQSIAKSFIADYFE